MFRLAHSERRLKGKESKCRIVEVVWLVYWWCLEQCTVSCGQPIEFMQRVALGSIFLYLPVVPDIALSTEFGQIHELICRHCEIEKLTDLYGPHRQWRPYVRGRQGVPQGVGAIVRPNAPIVVGVSRGVLTVLVI